MTRIILEGLMLGLSAGIYCVATCLVFFVPYLLVEGKKEVLENAKKILSFTLGRFMAYVIFAAFAGLIGTLYQNIFTAKFSYVALIIASLFMLIYTLTQKFKGSGFCAILVKRFSLLRIPFLLGVITGLNPCPPFLVGLARLWTLKNILGGVILFIAFFCGTSIYMIPLFFVSYITKGERIREIGLMVALLSSVWFLIVGITGLIR